MANEKHSIDIEAKGRGLKEIRKDLADAKDNLIKTQNEFGKFSAQAQTAGAKVTKFSGELKSANSSIRQFGATSKMSGLQLLEMGENLTVVVAGLQRVLQPLTNFISHSVTAGAELQVLKANFKGTAEDLEGFRIASAKTVSDASLIKLSNQASDLGVDLKQQTILFSLAENAADKYGGTVEENFLGLINSTEGATKVLKTLGIQKKVYEEAVKSLLPVGVKELEQLDAEAQKQIRIQALLKVSGESYEMATNKIQDNKDVLDSIGISLENFQAKLGDNVVQFFADQIRDSTEALNNFGISSKDAGSFLGEFSEKAVTHIDLLIKMVLPVTNLISVFKDLSERFKTIRDAVSDTNSAFGSLVNVLSQSVPTVLIDTINDVIDAARDKVRDLLYLLGVLGADKGGQGMGAIKTSTNNPPPVTRKNISNKGGSPTQEKQTQEEILNLVVLKNQELVKEQARLDANLGLVGAEYDIRLKILEIEKEIARLQFGDMASIEARIFGGDKTLAQMAGGLKNPRFNLNDPRQDAGEPEQEQVRDTFADISNTSSQTLGFFQNILSIAGETNSVFADILNGLGQFLGLMNAGKGLFDTIMSFIPGGGIISSVVGGASGGGLIPQMSNGGGMSFNPTLIVNSEVERTKSIKFYQNTFPNYDRRQQAKSL